MEYFTATPQCLVTTTWKLKKSNIINAYHVQFVKYRSTQYISHDYTIRQHIFKIFDILCCFFLIKVHSLLDVIRLILISLGHPDFLSGFEEISLPVDCAKKRTLCLLQRQTRVKQTKMFSYRNHNKNVMQNVMRRYITVGVRPVPSSPIGS